MRPRNLLYPSCKQALWLQQQVASSFVDQFNCLTHISTNRAGSLFAITTGYFLWDTMVSLIYLRENGPGFLIHAVLCCYVFVCSYKPFMQYYGVHFLLWELSSPFLNLHWFFDKCDLTYVVSLRGRLVRLKRCVVQRIKTSTHQWRYPTINLFWRPSDIRQHHLLRLFPSFIYTFSSSVATFAYPDSVQSGAGYFGRVECILVLQNGQIGH